MLVRYSSMSGVVVYISAVVTSIIRNIVIFAKTVDVIFTWLFCKRCIFQTYLMTHAFKLLDPCKIEFRVCVN